MQESMRARIYEHFEYEPQTEVSVASHSRNGDVFKSYTYTPGHVQNETPVVIAWGFATNNYVMSKFADDLALEGRVVTVVDEPLRTKSDGLIDGYDFEARNTGLFEQAIDDLEYEEVDIVAHSQGAIISRLYARRQLGRREDATAKPEVNIRSIVELAPAGQDRKGGKLRQTYGGFLEGLRTLPKMFTKGALRGLGRQAIMNTVNIKNSLGQQAEIAMADEHDSNKFLQKEAKIKIGMIMSHGDQLFKPHHLAGNDEGDIFAGRNAITSLRSPLAGHNAIFKGREASIAVDDMLRSLNGESIAAERPENEAATQRSLMRAKAAAMIARIIFSSKRSGFRGDSLPPDDYRDDVEDV